MDSTFWCHSCDRFIRIQTQHIAICPDCGGGFVEGIDSSSTFSPLSPISTPSSSINPVTDEISADNNQLYYYDTTDSGSGSGSGLRPLPISIAEFLMASGLNPRELDITTSLENPPASKAAVESIPVVRIGSSHVGAELHCAVCKEMFEIDVEARELPCKHIYHSECINPWLLMHNSCPVCRFKLPCEYDCEGALVGLRIWRLPGGGFAVGRFSGSEEEGLLPVVYSQGFEIENDDDFRRTSWSLRGRQSGRGRRWRRVFSSFFGLFTRNRDRDSSGVELGRNVSRSGSIFRRRQTQGWTFGV